MTDLFAAAQIETPSMALRQNAVRPSEPIIRQALIEDGCRWWAKRAWGAGPLILWAMCNPSDADGQRDDPTFWRIMEFSMRWGFGSCVAVNPIPLISSTPEATLKWMRRAEMWMVDGRDPTPEWALYQRNLVEVSKLMSAADAHVAAWGNNIPNDLARRWLQDIAEAAGDPCEDEETKPIEWLCLGTTNSGAPKHPLARGQHRVPPEFKPLPFKLRTAA